jgi:serine/threonine-protein kinase
MLCPSCQAENDDAAQTCFTCGHSLAAAIRRGSVLAGRYEILSLVGKGGMGMVYKAHDRFLDEAVAIKVLRQDVARAPDMAKRFRNEIRLARKVRHPNVCGIHEYHEEPGLRFIAMEFIEGVDLRRYLRERVTLPLDEAFDVSIQVAEGLSAIHEVGIVHRDLKTPNIMRDAKGHVRLMDFGIAKEVDGHTLGMTATGLVMGTPEYMSPEQARGERIDLRSDVYGVGVVIYEVFTGDVPYRGETPLATILKHLQSPLPFDSGNPTAARCPPSLVPVLRRALAKDPASRYASTRELVAALRQARATTQLPVTAATPAANPAVSPAAVPDSPPPTTPLPKGTPAATSSADRPTVATPTGRRAVRQASDAVAPPRPAPARRTPAWAVLAPIVLLLGLAGWLARDALFGPSPSPSPGLTPEPTPEPTPAPTPTPEPSPTPTDVPTPEPTPEPTPSPTPRPTQEPTPTPTPRPTPKPVGEGVLQVAVRPWAEVFVDGERGGETPLRLTLKAGPHLVRLVNPQFEPYEERVVVRPGEVTRLSVDLKAPRPR